MVSLRPEICSVELSRQFLTASLGQYNKQANNYFHCISLWCLLNSLVYLYEIQCHSIFAHIYTVFNATVSNLFNYYSTNMCQELDSYIDMHNCELSHKNWHCTL